MSRLLSLLLMTAGWTAHADEQSQSPSRVKPGNRECADIGSRLELFVDDFMIDDLAGKPVRLRVRLHDADLYSLRFSPGKDTH